MAEDTGTLDLQKQAEDLAKNLGSKNIETSAITKKVEDDELLSTEGKVLTGEGTTLTPKTIDTTALDTSVSTPTKKENVGQAPEKVTSSLSQIKDQDYAGATSSFQATDLIDLDDIATAELSDKAVVTPVTEELAKEATVKYQLSDLLSGIEEGKPLPAWASPAARKVTAIMQQRGMGASSMAAAALTQAVMESGIAVAGRDAQSYAALQLKNLDHKQQAALQNALQTATLDRQNANARVQASITNAQSLLAIDLKELDAQQQSNAIKYNSISQAALTEAAQQTAREQFNAKNELQVEEFFAELGTQIDTANVNREIAVKQFNINQENAFAEFNASMNDQREKFNANMKSVVDQSNAKWRREINTVNTATQNEVNRINTQLLYNQSATSLNNLWQKYRDNATFNFTASESEIQRQHEQVIQSLEVAANADAYSKAQKTTLASNIIKVIGAW